MIEVTCALEIFAHLTDAANEQRRHAFLVLHVTFQPIVPEPLAAPQRPLSLDCPARVLRFASWQITTASCRPTTASCSIACNSCAHFLIGCLFFVATRAMLSRSIHRPSFAQCAARWQTVSGRPLTPPGVHLGLNPCSGVLPRGDCFWGQLVAGVLPRGPISRPAMPLTRSDQEHLNTHSQKREMIDKMTNSPLPMVLRQAEALERRHSRASRKACGRLC